jgi:hypothetical protein
MRQDRTLRKLLGLLLAAALPPRRIRAVLTAVVLLAAWAGVTYVLNNLFTEAGEDHHLSAAVTASATIALVLVTAYLTSHLIHVTQLASPAEQEIREFAKALGTFALALPDITFGWDLLRDETDKRDEVLRLTEMDDLRRFREGTVGPLLSFPYALQPGIQKLFESLSHTNLAMDQLHHAVLLRGGESKSQKRTWSWERVTEYCRKEYPWMAAKDGREPEIAEAIGAQLEDIQAQLIEYSGVLQRWSQR